ncbi:MAG TPA: Gfo/Idh/MocA family oxidoreductase [Tepidisphaeraceae bacterium]|nr:Gfo/Idh/MocA family oxidoreductase [Tepidisphaeraceae bacterium]
MKTTLRWGILGAGNIARQFAGSFATADRGKLIAIGSRRAETARAFAATYSAGDAFGSYEQLIASKDVDAVYVALPNSMHREWTIKALKAGKHVLCEKPIASNSGEALEMFDTANRAGRVLMEAFMYRSHPLTEAVRNAVRSGKIGRVKLIRTSFCFRVWNTTNNIRFDPALAGGALMDIGCYCVNFSRLIAGAEPTGIYAAGQSHASGVDELVAGVMQFPGGVTASFTCGMNAQADNSASICGDEGYIEIPVPWKPPVKNAAWSLAYSIPPKMDQAAGVVAPARPKETFAVDAGKALYALESDDFAAAVLDGAPLRVSAEDTLGNMRVIDEMRKQIAASEI